MGANCCGGEYKLDKDANLMQNNGILIDKRTGKKIQNRQPEKVPIHLVVRM